MAASRNNRSGDQAEVKASADEVQANFDEINDKGYMGERVDPTPLDNYTVSGAVAGKPTPETDAKAAAKAAEATSTPPQVTG